MSKQLALDELAHYIRSRKLADLKGCWIWPGRKDANGYGYFWDGKYRFYVHRLSFELRKGPIPPGMDVLHKCDNPPCFNWDHLFLGTESENMQDMAKKGRAAWQKRRKRLPLSDGLVRTDSECAVILLDRVGGELKRFP